MGRRGVRRGLLAATIWVLSALWGAAAVAQPGIGPRETVDQMLTTTRPDSPTGLGLTGVYHAAGDPHGNPPPLLRSVVYPPRGMRFDTDVPERCTASDAQLQVMGPAACPAGSRLGEGKIEGIFFTPFAHALVLDRYKHDVEVFNNANEQIFLVRTEGFAVYRAPIHPDGSIEFEFPACYPASPTGRCPDDHVLQLAASNFIPAYTRTSGGRAGSYATTPPTCPSSGSWRTTFRLWWADGLVDSVTSTQPCTRPAKRERRARRVGHRRRGRLGVSGAGPGT